MCLHVMLCGCFPFDASAEDEMYEVEEQLDKANAILKKEKEAAAASDSGGWAARAGT